MAALRVSVYAYRENCFVLLCTYNLQLTMTLLGLVSGIPFNHSQKTICEKSGSLVSLGSGIENIQFFMLYLNKTLAIYS